MSLKILQTKYFLWGTLLAPFLPFLYLQGKYARYKIGRLPDASGPTIGTSGEGNESVRLLVIGESTAAGVGARTHEEALAGHFGRNLSRKIGCAVEWTVIGRSGITIGETIDELVPKIPGGDYDFIMLALCGNEVLKLNSPGRSRRDMIRLIGTLRETNPRATFFMTNAPAVRLSPILPNPLKAVLGALSALHDANARDYTSSLERVYYFRQPTYVPDGFFADGIHPSELGYRVWSERMVEYFEQEYGW